MNYICHAINVHFWGYDLYVESESRVATNRKWNKLSESERIEFVRENNCAVKIQIYYKDKKFSYVSFSSIDDCFSYLSDIHYNDHNHNEALQFEQIKSDAVYNYDRAENYALGEL